MRSLRAALVLSSFASGCSGSDLPADWKDAKQVSSLSQSDCDDLLIEPVDEAMRVTGRVLEVAIDLKDIPFRCQQPVAAYEKRSQGKLEVLVQPEDMDPSAVARCGCGYSISIVVRDVVPGPVAVSAWRRWDNINVPNDPVFIGTRTATVSGSQ